MKKSKVAIIGGGSSGLFLANLLDKNKFDIVIFEKNDKLGKKILASGNGKCNFTNISTLDNKYNNKFANMIVNRFDVNKTLSEFKKMGLLYKSDEEGRIYPLSESAVSVLDCLKLGLNNVKIYMSCAVKKIEKKDNKYLVYTSDFIDEFDYVVLCSGSAASNLGSEKAYSYLSDCNINISSLHPSLTPIKTYEDVSQLKGVRIKCNVSLLDKDDKIYSENGEILFKEDGLSGIAVFNISSYINRKKGNYKVSLDLTNGMSKEEVINYLKNKNKEKLFTGFLHNKIGDYIICKLKKQEDQFEDIYKLIKKLTFSVKELYPLKDAQICSGGIMINEIKENLEFKNYPHMYAAGELLDVDGLCGGYNLQFAWSSAGVIANDLMVKQGENNEEK